MSRSSGYHRPSSLLLVLARARAAVAGPRGDAGVGRWTLGSRPAIARSVRCNQLNSRWRSTSLAPTGFSRGQAISCRPGLRTGFAFTNRSELVVERRARRSEARFSNLVRRVYSLGPTQSHAAHFS